MNSFINISKYKLAEIFKLSKSAQETLGLILKQFDGSIEQKFDRSRYSKDKAKIQQLKRGMAELKREEYILSIPSKKGYYILNPYIFEYEKNNVSKKLWDEYYDEVHCFTDIDDDSIALIKVIDKYKKYLTEDILNREIKLKYHVEKSVTNNQSYFLDIIDDYIDMPYSYKNILNSLRKLLRKDIENKHYFGEYILDFICKKYNFLRDVWENDDNTYHIFLYTATFEDEKTRYFSYKQGANFVSDIENSSDNFGLLEVIFKYADQIDDEDNEPYLFCEPFIEYYTNDKFIQFLHNDLYDKITNYRYLGNYNTLDGIDKILLDKYPEIFL